MCIFKNKHMKLIIKNDSKETVKNPNVKIIETTKASFANQVVILESNDVPIIKYTDIEFMYFVKDLDNLYDRKSKSEVLLNITIDNLEAIGGGNPTPVDSRPYKVYTALLTQSGTNAPVATVLENTLGGDITWSRNSTGDYSATSNNLFTENKTYPVSETPDNGYISQIIRIDENIVSLTITPSEDNISQVSQIKVEIRVYN